ncbi:Hypothetical predicted protein [Mytilus galloprovincialis]|uniref:Uncharacterized protein n=1 Tax=Mytilus galloprovincialis TaxID=29158 RepID=A0A8B6EIY9_MYTGA|nr:Hypothetical predicted protein [Mytilus galloprovincialis]
MTELDSRKIDFDCSLKPDLQAILTTTLHGICRPPALMTNSPHLTSQDLNIGKYEILGCEPLHDLTNVIQNVITELPCHISDSSVQKLFSNFSNSTIGDKNQIKGSDARLFLVKLAQFTSDLHGNGKLEDNIMQLINSLVEVVNISYLPSESRTPKIILRLYNQALIFGMVCRNVIGKPSKMTSRKFYGSHFHSVTVHLPNTLRIFSLRSVHTEQEERCFGDLRRISEMTTNRQPKWIADNAMLRFNSQQNAPDKPESFKIQDSIISRQARLLPERRRSTFSAELINKRPSFVQCHLERIADFMLQGQDVWWHFENGALVFFDGPNDPSSRPEGPPLHHFRSSGLKEEGKILKNAWAKVVDKFESGYLLLPLKKLKVFDDDGNSRYVSCEKNTLKEDDASDITISYQPHIPDYEATKIIKENDRAKDQIRDSSLLPVIDCRDSNDEVSNVMEEGCTLLKVKPSHHSDPPEVHVLAVDHQRHQLENSETKEKYKSYIKVLRWVEQPYSTDAHENTTVKPKLPAPRRKKTTFDLVVQLLGPSSDVDDCIKYRELKLKHPGHKSFVSAFDQSFSKLQIEVSKKYFALKDKTANNDGKENMENLLADKEIAQKLLDHWEVYYF